MNRIESIFNDLRSEGRTALMPFVCGGRPSLELMGPLLRTMQDAGASIAEIGIPFSDPIADGPVISAAMHRALEQGVTPRAILERVGAIRGELDLGLVAMVSISILQRLGVGSFGRDARSAGFDGFIVPDVPIEEARRLLEPLHDEGLTCSLLIAPTTSPERVEQIALASTGFVYLLARAGITGESQEAPEIEARVQQIRAVSDIPVACGFGISTAEHVASVTAHADAAIVGTALVRRLELASEDGHDPIAGTDRFVRHLAGGLAGAEARST